MIKANLIELISETGITNETIFEINSFGSKYWNNILEYWKSMRTSSLRLDFEEFKETSSLKTLKAYLDTLDRTKKDMLMDNLIVDYIIHFHLKD